MGGTHICAFTFLMKRVQTTYLYLFQIGGYVQTDPVMFRLYYIQISILNPSFILFLQFLLNISHISIGIHLVLHYIISSFVPCVPEQRSACPVMQAPLCIHYVHRECIGAVSDRRSVRPRAMSGHGSLCECTLGNMLVILMFFWI